jgi:hypothetical protein
MYSPPHDDESILLESTPSSSILNPRHTLYKYSPLFLAGSLCESTSPPLSWTWWVIPTALVLVEKIPWGWTWWVIPAVFTQGDPSALCKVDWPPPCTEYNGDECIFLQPLSLSPSRAELFSARVRREAQEWKMRDRKREKHLLAWALFTSSASLGKGSAIPKRSATTRHLHVVRSAQPEEGLPLFSWPRASLLSLLYKIQKKKNKNTTNVFHMDLYQHAFYSPLGLRLTTTCDTEG